MLLIRMWHSEGSVRFRVSKMTLCWKEGSHTASGKSLKIPRSRKGGLTDSADEPLILDDVDLRAGRATAENGFRVEAVRMLD
ncbi:hypothetical protein Poly59_38940 [Rubripirellula reticaptiva]|uniref:Uncharacterized protein n=1 Tax=Rubripirellula reticaptiva TaxID=2528013 RepID=A0A5C6ELG4_9BACT|nr:hypothetical protein Poly59_38940 [Rubripirellula reticaptiva]